MHLKTYIYSIRLEQTISTVKGSVWCQGAKPLAFVRRASSSENIRERTIVREERSSEPTTRLLT